MHAQLALLHAERGDLPRAADLAATALSWAERGPGAPPEALAHLADGVWRAFARDPGATAALTRAIGADPAGDQALFATGYRCVLTGDPSDRRQIEAHAASGSASPATRAFAAAVGGAAVGAAWVHVRLLGRLRASGEGR